MFLFILCAIILNILNWEKNRLPGLFDPEIVIFHTNANYSNRLPVLGTDLTF